MEWRLMPKEPTEEMLYAIALRFAFKPQEEDMVMAAEAYRALLRATPLPKEPA